MRADYSLMRIFDSFIFSDEIELLRLRLAVMGPHVDGFLVVEGDRTFTGFHRELQFPKYADVLPYREKIIYVPVREFPETDSPWVREHFLRDQIRSHVPAEPDDIVLISDVDEIINLPEVMVHYDRERPARIEIPCFYHFLDVQSSQKFCFTLISPFRYIENVAVGNRNTYKSLAPSIILDRDGKNGGHFTFMYGYDTDKYEKKIGNFSHQELNTSHYKDHNRILKCVAWNLDLFERDQFRYKQVPLKSIFPDMADAIRHSLTALPIKAKTPRPFWEGLSRYREAYFWKRKYHQSRHIRARMKRRCLDLIGK